MKAHPYTGSAILLVALAALIGWQSLPGSDGSAPSPGQSGFARVERVVDGDTVVLSGGLGSSRLVGVDTPETVKPGAPVECFGRRASDFAKRVLGDAGRVRYRVAREPIDPYGRALVYLWLADGHFFNALLVRGGYARPLPIAPNTRYAPRFQRLAEEAAARGRGLWGRC